MEGVVEAHNFVLLTGGLPYLSYFACEFYGGFVGFAAGVADEDFGGFVHGARFVRFVDEELGEGASPGVMIEVGSMYQCSCLLILKSVHLRSEPVWACLPAGPLILPFLDHNGLTR